MRAKRFLPGSIQRTLEIAMFLLAASGLALAATQNVTCTGAGKNVELSNATITCPQFNPASGELTGVAITLNGEIFGSITLTNDTPATQSASATTTTDFSLSSPLAGFSFPGTVFTGSFTTGTRTLGPQGSGTDVFSSGGLNSGPLTTGPLTDSTNSTFATYEGAGQFTIGFNTATNFVLTGNVEQFHVTHASVTATVVYTFVEHVTLTCATTGTTGEVGVPFNSPALIASGGVPPFTFSLASGTLPMGLTLNTATGAITGTPTATGSWTLQATDSIGATATTTCPYGIGTQPTLTCPATGTAGTVGIPFNSPAINVTGGTPPYTFSIVGTIAPGLTLNTTTGAITGTPTATGSWSVKVTDASGLVTNTCPYGIGLANLCPAPAYRVHYAANLNVGESYINIANPGTDGASLLGPGLGSAQGNICVNVYAFDPNEELVSCCSCLVTPDQTVNLGVNRDLVSKTLTGIVPNSVTVKLVSTLAGPGGAGASCSNSAATVATGIPACGLTAWGTNLHATPTPGNYDTTESPFTPATLSPGEMASLAGRCSSIVGNGSGFGICSSCRAGALGGAKF